MKVVIFTFTCISFVFANPPRKSACSFSCKGLPNADYPDPCGPPCNPIYYTCWNERAEQQRCSVGDVFDSTQGTCVDIQWCTPPPPPPVVTFLASFSCQLFRLCSFDCKGLPNGDYEDPCVDSCAQSYYTCWNGQAERQRCSPGAAFDANSRQCVDKQWCEPKCEPSDCSFTCKGRPNGDYADPCLPSCSKSYYTCWNGQAEQRICSRGEVFDENSGRCVDVQWCKPSPKDRRQKSSCKRIGTGLLLKFYLICTRVGGSGDTPNKDDGMEVLWGG